MYKKLISMILTMVLVLGLLPIGTAFAANSEQALRDLVPGTAEEFRAGGGSTNGLNGPNTIWWDYNPATRTGDVYLLVASSNAGKVAKGARLGGVNGSVLDSFAPGGNRTAFTLIKFSGVWLIGDELIQVDMGNGYGTGQEIKGSVNDYFPQLKNITYYDGDTWLGTDAVLSGKNAEIRGEDYFKLINNGYVFVGWAVTNGGEAEWFPGDSMLVGDKDIDLYAVWDRDSFEYVVEYYYDGVKDDSKIEKKSADFEDEISEFPDKAGIGYKFDSTDPELPLIISSNPAENVLKVYYVRDDSQTRNVVYTVKYTRDGVEVTADTYTVTVPVWINEPADFAVPVAAISAANDRYVGYKLANNPFVAPATAKQGDMITVPYIKDDSQTRDVVYTVNYTLDGAEVVADTYTVTVPVWINEPADFAVPVAAISAANNRYVGYKLETNPFVAPATAQNSDIITVPYIRDNSQTRNVVYTVKYTIDGTEVVADTYTVTVPVWINEPAGFGVPVAAISAANDRYVGYKLENSPFAAPATVKHGDVITVPYTRDDSWTKKLSYTVNYYKDGVFEESESVTEEVWVNAPDILVVQLIDHNKYLPAYGFDSTDPAQLPETIADGGEIGAYYKRIIFTVSYEPGTQGLFEEEIYEDQPYGIVTPPFTGNTADCNTGWIFDGWEPVVSSTVTKDEIYVAQWKQIPYVVRFLLGNAAMGDALVGQATYDPVFYGNEMPAPPHPYAKFSYKFIGWKGDDGSYIEAPDFTKPTYLPNYPETVSGSVTYTAQWGIVNPSITFPDKIPSEAHFDRWWGDYGIICFSASSTKNDMYTIMFADWFFDVYRYVRIGYGSPGKMDYEIRFNEKNISLWNMNSGKEITNSGTLKLERMTCIKDGQYFTKAKNHNYGNDFGGNGTLQGVSFLNPFGSGAKLAWLY